MKKIKYYALAFIGLSLLTAGLYACSNEDAVNMQKDESGRTLTTKSNDVFEGDKIAAIVNGTSVPLYDKNEVKQALLDSGAFVEVESIELAYGLDTELKKQVAFVTVIGTETIGAPVVAVVGDLIIDGGTLVVPNESNLTTFSKHSCTSENCSSCSFTKTGFFGKITGCSDCLKPAYPDKPGACMHSINSGGGAALQIAKELVKASVTL